VQLHYSALAGMLAEALSQRLPGGLDAAFFASTGAEAVDSAMKFARAATRRPRLISCDSSFHGVTLGPLSLVGDEFFKDGFGPLLPGCARVPFGDLDRLEEGLRTKDVAAFIVEPIQGRMVTLPPAGYLQAAQELRPRDGLVEHAVQVGSVLSDGLAEMGQRYEMLKEVRGRGLMIGIELGAPSSRAGKLNWRLIHMASGGLFPQLVVIPLHRDHRVITMAAGKNDVIKLLPPLTLSDSEVGSFLDALDAVLADVHGA